MIQDLFKKNDKDYVNLTNQYLEKISKNVKARGGKMVTGREMNEIYQEGGYYHYLGMQNEGLHHELVPDRGIDVSRDSGINFDETPIFVLKTRDAPGTYGFGNDSGATINTPDIVQNELTGDSPTLSYGVNNTPCAGTTTNSNSQCAGTSRCTVSYKTSAPPKTIFSKMWGFLNNENNSDNTVSETSNGTNVDTKTCAPTQTEAETKAQTEAQTGGAKSQKKKKKYRIKILINYLIMPILKCQNTRKSSSRAL